MKRLIILIMSLTIIAIFSAAICCAEEVKGEVIKMNDSRLEIKVKGEGSRSFDIIKTTSIFAGGMPCPTKRLVPHTRVRVAGRHGNAEWIFVEEAPK